MMYCRILNPNLSRKFFGLLFGFERARSLKSDRDVLLNQIRGLREENILVDGKSRTNYRDVKTGRFIKKP